MTLAKPSVYWYFKKWSFLINRQIFFPGQKITSQCLMFDSPKDRHLWLAAKILALVSTNERFGSCYTLNTKNIRFIKHIVIFGLWLTISKNNHFELLKVSVPKFIPSSFYFLVLVSTENICHQSISCGQSWWGRSCWIQTKNCK